MAAGAKAMKSNLEKAVKGMETAAQFNKDNAEAYQKSAAVAGKGVEAINAEMQAYSKQLFEGSITATKAIMSSKSFHEAIELQTDFAKAVLEAYVTQLTKVGELSNTVAKDSLEPIRERVDIFVQSLQLNYD